MLCTIKYKSYWLVIDTVICSFDSCHLVPEMYERRLKSNVHILTEKLFKIFANTELDNAFQLIVLSIMVTLDVSFEYKKKRKMGG